MFPYHNVLMWGAFFQDELSGKFEVRGIPALIILDRATGAVKDAKGRAAVEADKDGSYPSNWWFPSKSYRNNGQMVKTSLKLDKSWSALFCSFEFLLFDCN